MSNPRAEKLRDFEARLEALERKRAAIPPGELAELDAKIQEFREIVEILREGGFDRPLSRFTRPARGRRGRSPRPAARGSARRCVGAKNVRRSQRTTRRPTFGTGSTTCLNNTTAA